MAACGRMGIAHAISLNLPPSRDLALIADTNRSDSPREQWTLLHQHMNEQLDELARSFNSSCYLAPPKSVSGCVRCSPDEE